MASRRLAAGLVFVSDEMPGIRRVRKGRSFGYLKANGKPASKSDVARSSALAIPPAWKDVWISPLPNGHLQATGRDARGRKQYRYHTKWREHRDETKHHRSLEFAAALPAIRARVKHDLALSGMPREKVLATVVSLLESTLIRVGNEEYSKDNNTYGLTTLRNSHAEVRGSKVRFKFKGKGSKPFSINVNDKRLAAIVRKCKDLPGQVLFEYQADDTSVHRISSADVNAYIRELSGGDFTAKDFRTWSATVLAAAKLIGKPFENQTEGKSNVVAAITEVADELGNTPAICRKSYVNPAVTAAYLDGKLAIAKRSMRAIRGLSRDETTALRLLKRLSSAPARR